VSFTWKAQSQAHKQRRRINLSTGHKDTRETRVPGPKSHKVYIISYYKYDKSDPAVPYAATKPPPRTNCPNPLFRNHPQSWSPIHCRQSESLGPNLLPLQCNANWQLGVQQAVRLGKVFITKA